MSDDPRGAAFDAAKKKLNRRNDIDIGLARDPELREHYDAELSASRRQNRNDTLSKAASPFQSANGIIALAIGAYILVCVARGNGQALWTLIKNEGGFIKWGVAVSILWWLATRPELGDVGTGLITVTILGLAIRAANDPAIINGIAAAWRALPDSKATATQQ